MAVFSDAGIYGPIEFCGALRCLFLSTGNPLRCMGNTETLPGKFTTCMLSLGTSIGRICLQSIANLKSNYGGVRIWLVLLLVFLYIWSISTVRSACFIDWHIGTLPQSTCISKVPYGISSNTSRTGSLPQL